MQTPQFRGRGGHVVGMVPFERALVSSSTLDFARNFRLQFSVGVANRFLVRGGRMGSGLVPFERALVSFYRSSIVTFPLSLRVSEILPLLFSSTPLFPYPTSSLPQIPHVPLGKQGKDVDLYSAFHAPGTLNAHTSLKLTRQTAILGHRSAC